MSSIDSSTYSYTTTDRLKLNHSNQLLLESTRECKALRRRVRELEEIIQKNHYTIRDDSLVETVEKNRESSKSHTLCKSCVTLESQRNTLEIELLGLYQYVNIFILSSNGKNKYLSNYYFYNNIYYGF